MIFRYGPKLSNIITPFIGAVGLTVSATYFANRYSDEHNSEPEQSLVSKFSKELTYLFGAAAFSSVVLAGIEIANAEKEIKENKPQYEKLKSEILNDTKNTVMLENGTINQYTAYATLSHPQKARFLDGNTGAQNWKEITQQEIQEQFLLRELLPDGRIIEHHEPQVKDGIFSENAFMVKGTTEYTPQGQKTERKIYTTKYGTKLEFRDNMIIHAEFPDYDKEIKYYYDSNKVRKALNAGHETEYYIGIFKGDGILCTNEQFQLLAGMYIGEKGKENVKDIYVKANSETGKVCLNNNRVIDTKDNLSQAIQNFNARDFYFTQINKDSGR